MTLPDEAKYKAQMSGVKQMLNAIITMRGTYNSFVIAMNQVKKKDRNILYYILDNMNKPDFNLEKVERQGRSSGTIRTKNSSRLKDKISKEYFLQTYGISFLIACFSLFILSIDDMTWIIGSFLLFPFAKIVYDVIIGFKIDEKMKKQDTLVPAFYGLIYTIYLLLFLSSIVVAPFGIVFMVIRAMYLIFKKIREA